MNYHLTQKPSLNHSDCLVIGMFSDSELPDFALDLDKKHEGIISKLLKKATEPGDLVWQSFLQDNSVLIVQCGKKAEFTPGVLQKRVRDIAESLIKQRISSATLCLPALVEHSAEWQLEQMIIQIDNQRYQLLDFKKKNARPHFLNTITLYLPGANEEVLKAALAVSAGVELTRHLANMPANICTPTYLAEQAQKLAEQFKSIKCSVMGLEEIQTMGMGALLAVSQGSAQAPRFIDIQYQGADPKDPPIILVGKGVTFDSGGLSLKPANMMDEMKYDMAGAASVLGTLNACALLQLPINVIGLIASAENLVSGSAVKPGDIITSMSGQTIEIINTDAEGRLVLADALTYAQRYQPKLVLDIATLTGAVIVALGTINTGFMTQDDELAGWIEQAAKQSEDRVWRLPLDEAYQDALDSPLADMINASFDRTAGSITAACFLSRFAQNFRWAHLDIAGTGWISGKKRNATGRPVPLLTQLIRNMAQTK